ncbi:MAG TPA: M20/M25/M40 family metallo-hydrolase [Niabella sp.]|mgnify:CR=1 FL=1|nr:M20/M25/M40 family metallo-hydrolase [Niabella sp.]HOZ98253.1 M20/M25/M40 family metallo-hydrolase [Niabella sp.]HQW13187.1 M20/M25/M40 family metallo-hydrolase [Niabella sp.]HQX18773.1 M20/M25/M40 family metallo-hydrolase [Niabella sp.]HQX41163.1 M20/M25/M40 family metallo-hydrolase [Niabella sp.]
MIQKLLLPFLFLMHFNAYAQHEDAYYIRKIADEVLVNSKAYDNLKVLTKTIGARLAGSPQMYKAEEWGYKLLQQSGSTNTFKQPVMVPHWVRGGKDEAYAILPNGQKKVLNVIAIGNTIGSKGKPLTATVMLINNFEELEAKKDELKGKIVFYNYKFNSKFIRTFEAYGDAVKYRSQGASRAAKYGAIAVLVRSMSHSTNNAPHTGALSYDEKFPKIPAIAVGLQDADWLATSIEKTAGLRLQVKTNGHFFPDAEGHNVIGELQGKEFPDRFITIGGHLDSWDNCEGAHDDGAGIVQTIEVLRALVALGYKPRHTIRFVLFANEENGLRGGVKYAELAKENNERHVFAVESDAGGFTPRALSFDCNEAVFERMKSWQPLIAPYGCAEFFRGGSGADIGPLKSKFGIPLCGFLPDSQRYFDIHHASTDVFESVNKRELELGAVNMAALIYLVDKYGL